MFAEFSSEEVIVAAKTRALSVDYTIECPNNFIVLYGQEAAFEFGQKVRFPKRFPKRYSRKKRKLLRAKWNIERDEYIKNNIIIKDIYREEILKELLNERIRNGISDEE